MSQNTKSKTFTVALSMVICLFFLWAISNNLLSSVVKKMMTLFDIDQARAEEELRSGDELYCLGDIVHNGIECERLQDMGLKTINHEQFSTLHGAKVLLRAHGEPPSTYDTARRNGITLIDATCPVVLKLQQRIHRQYEELDPHTQQIVIFGQKGHAEVLGLVGQTEGTATVIESVDEMDGKNSTLFVNLKSQRPFLLFFNT